MIYIDLLYMIIVFYRCKLSNVYEQLYTPTDAWKVYNLLMIFIQTSSSTDHVLMGCEHIHLSIKFLLFTAYNVA